jgi:hypothetical protein
MEEVAQMEFRLAKIEDAQLRTEKNMDKLSDAVMKLAEAETDRALLHQKVNALEEHHKEDYEKTQKQFDKIFTRIREEDKIINSFVPASTLKWFIVVILGYAISFGVWTNNKLANQSERLTAKIERDIVQLQTLQEKIDWYCDTHTGNKI